MEVMMMMKLADDPGVQACRAARRDKARELAAAEAARLRLEQAAEVSAAVATSDFAILEARQEERRLRGEYEAAVRAGAEAERSARERIHASRRRGLRQLDGAVIEAAARAQALALEREEYARQTSDLAEGRDLEDQGAPLPQLLGLPLETARARLDGPSRPVQPEVPAGMREVRVRAEVLRDDQNIRRRGDVILIKEKELRRLLREGAVEELAPA